MKTVHDIAQGLAVEINERFGIQAQAVAGMHYDLKKEGKEQTGERIGEKTSDFINSYQVTHKRFNITVKPDRFYFSVASPEAENWAGEVAGLPGVVLKTQIDRNPEAHEYLLADPSSIDSMMDRIEELLNEDSTNSNETPPTRQGNVGTFGISIGGIIIGEKREEESETPPVRGGDKESIE